MEFATHSFSCKSVTANPTAKHREFIVYLGTMVKKEEIAAVAATVPSPKASVALPSVNADRTFKKRGLLPNSRTLS